MRKLIIPAAAAALLAGASIANAAMTTGAIKNINPMKDTLTLANGATYKAPSSMKLSAFKVGEKVNVTYSHAHGMKEVTALKPAA